VLSEAVKQTGILKQVASVINDATASLSAWGVLAVFCLAVGVCTTFISHTVGAMVILPVVQSVGKALPIPHPRMLVMANVLMCSGAMGLPVSGAHLQCHLSLLQASDRV
jgi:phosphate transporter